MHSTSVAPFRPTFIQKTRDRSTRLKTMDTSSVVDGVLASGNTQIQELPNYYRDYRFQPTRCQKQPWGRHSMILSSPAFTKRSQARFSESWGAQNHRMRPPRLFLTTGGLKLGSPYSSVWRKKPVPTGSNQFLPVWRKNRFKQVPTGSQLG